MKVPDLCKTDEQQFMDQLVSVVLGTRRSINEHHSRSYVLRYNSVGSTQCL